MTRLRLSARDADADAALPDNACIHIAYQLVRTLCRHPEMARLADEQHVVSGLIKLWQQVEAVDEPLRLEIVAALTALCGDKPNAVKLTKHALPALLDALRSEQVAMMRCAAELLRFVARSKARPRRLRCCAPRTSARCSTVRCSTSGCRALCTRSFTCARATRRWWRRAAGGGQAVLGSLNCS